MNSITLGRYVPGNTLLHKLDPRTKLFGLFIILISIFFDIGWFQYAFLTLSIIGLLIISKTSLFSIFSSLKHMWMMMLILLIINCFVYKEGIAIFTIKSFTLYSSALINTLEIFLRLFMMIALSTMLTATTKPLELTYAIEWYFSPLKVINFPAHEIAMTISIALRFIPTLLDETYKIMKAQASRGVDLQNGTLKDKINGVVSLIIPLFVSSFQRSEELANAMEARGYNPSGKRTRYRQLKFHLVDLFSLFGCMLIVFITIFTVYNGSLFNGFLRP